VGHRSRIKELEKLTRGDGEFRKSRREVPLDIAAELQNPASITGCYTDPIMDPADIFEEEED